MLKLIRKIILIVAGAVVLSGVLGFVVKTSMNLITDLGTKKGLQVDASILLQPTTWGIGALAVLLIGIIYLLSGNNLDDVFGHGRGLLGKKGKVDVVEGSLENR